MFEHPLMVHLSFRFYRFLADLGISIYQLAEKSPVLLLPKSDERRPE